MNNFDISTTSSLDSSDSSDNDYGTTQPKGNPLQGGTNIGITGKSEMVQ